MIPLGPPAALTLSTEQLRASMSDGGSAQPLAPEAVSAGPAQLPLDPSMPSALATRGTSSAAATVSPLELPQAKPPYTSPPSTLVAAIATVAEDKVIAPAASSRAGVAGSSQAVRGPAAPEIIGSVLPALKELANAIESTSDASSDGSSVHWLTDEEADEMEAAAASHQLTAEQAAPQGASAVVRRVVYPPVFGDRVLALRTFHASSTLPLQPDKAFVTFVSAMHRLRDLPNGSQLLGAHRSRQWTVWPYYGGGSLEEKIASGGMNFRDRAEFALRFLQWVRSLPTFLPPSPLEIQYKLAPAILHCDLKVGIAEEEEGYVWHQHEHRKYSYCIGF